MSSSRRKAKKLEKRQNREIKTAQPSLPKAKRKGGQYVYPAGAYRAARPVPPVLPPAETAEAAPVLIPVPEEPLIKEPPVPEMPVPEMPVPETPVPENGTAGQLPSSRRMALPFVIAAFVLMGWMVLSASRHTAEIITDTFKEAAEPVLREASLPLEPLDTSIHTEILRAPLETYLDTLAGDWAVYVENLANGETLTINGHQMPSASLIKLFTAGTYFEECEAGRLSPTPASETNLANMISWSDNDAWQALETAIGHGNYNNGLQMVTAFAQDRGFADTGRLIGGASIYSANANNLTSVSDVGAVLKQVYEGTYVSEAASAQLLDLMKAQHRTAKIPAGLPEGVESANKTGELAGIENDAAIVFGEETDYILVIMSDGNYNGTEPLTEISAMVYELLNPGTEES